MVVRIQSEISCARTSSRRRRRLPGLALLAAGGIVYGSLIRSWQLHWGATAEEASAALPGDDLVAVARYVTTRAVTIETPPEAVWPWLVQLGQGRAGFYTYDRLEQFVGAAIRSADRIRPELQQLAEGETVRLSPVGGPKVAILEPARALVLEDTMDLRTGQSVPPGTASSFVMNCTWSFTLRQTYNRATRLVVRTRADFRPHALLAPVVPILLEPAHFVMERGMLLGIKRRAERQKRVEWNSRPSGSGRSALVGGTDCFGSPRTKISAFALAY